MLETRAAETRAAETRAAETRAAETRAAETQAETQAAGCGLQTRKLQDVGYRRRAA